VLLHAAVRIFQPEVLPVRGSLPTLVLPAGPHPYTAADLAQYGALVRLKHHAALLIDNVFVSTNATLDLASPELHVLYLDSSTDGFASIEAWNGNLEFAGTQAEPMTITGWDRIAKTPASDRGFGRSYIREVGGKMTLTNVRTSSLGFWSGRTGGVAWTGLTGHPSTGGRPGRRSATAPTARSSTAARTLLSLPTCSSSTSSTACTSTAIRPARRSRSARRRETAQRVPGRPGHPEHGAERRCL